MGAYKNYEVTQENCKERASRSRRVILETFVEYTELEELTKGFKVY